MLILDGLVAPFVIVIVTPFVIVTAFRCGRVASALAHEFAHLTVLGSSSFSSNNCMGNVRLADWGRSLLPWGPLALTPFVVVPVAASSWRQAAAEAAGWMFSAALAVFSWTAVLSSTHISLASTAVAVGVTFTALGAVSTDLLGLLPSSADGATGRRLFCGNFGLLMLETLTQRRATVTGSETSVDALAVLESMATVSMQRGGQSGGIVHLWGPPGHVQGLRTRHAPSKRESLAGGLLRRFGAELRNRWRRPPPAAGCSLYAGHTRFATSSVPRVHESHPHTWVPERLVTVHRVVATHGGLAVIPTRERLGTYITHNGDLDFFALYGADRTHGEVATWLGATLHVPPPAACDSACVAGLFDLFMTKGCVLESLRAAWALTVATRMQDAYPGGEGGDPRSFGAPGLGDLAPLAALFETALATRCRLAVRETPHAGQEATLLTAVGGPPGEAALVTALTADAATTDAVRGLWSALRGGDLESVQGLDHTTLARFWEATVAAFLHADVFGTARAFFAGATGSFGLVVCTTLQPDTVIVAALNQAMALGVAPGQTAVLWSSEAQSLKTHLGGRAAPPASPPASGDNGWRPGHCTHRLDLDESRGEIVELRLRPVGSGGDTMPMLGATSTGSPGDGPNGRGWPLFRGDDWSWLQVRAWAITDRRLVQPGEWGDAGRLISLRENPYISFDLAPRVAGRDAVAADLVDIPRVLAAVVASFRGGESPTPSPNMLAASAFYSALRRRLREITVAEGGAFASVFRTEIDVLVVGVENSLWLGEEFVAALCGILPRLRVTVLSANKVIGVLGNARGHAALPGSAFSRATSDLSRALVLLLSHSGQTFPTLAAARVLQRACPGRVFAVCGSLDRKLAAAVGQSAASDAPCAARAFTTHAGWRGAEPCTVSTLAMHCTLSEILWYVAARMATTAEKGVPSQRLFGLTLTRADCADLRRTLDAFVNEAVPRLVGVGPPICGAAVGLSDVSVHAQLVAAGHKWALHVTEAPTAWIITAVYVLVTVILGVPLFTTIAGAVGGDLGPTCPWSPEAAPCGPLRFLMGLLDACLYVFLWPLACLALRFVQRRTLLARFGRRTLIICDTPAVHQLLESFVSKLFSLSYGIAGLDVHGANPGDHFVHRFTHRVSRGLLLAVGRPDGRLCSQTRPESWTLMALLQAKVIQSLGAQPEVLSVGHNPYRNPVTMDNAVILPTSRPRCLCEALAGAPPEGTHHGPGHRMAANNTAAGAPSAGALKGTAPTVLAGYFDAVALAQTGPHALVGRHLVVPRVVPAGGALARVGPPRSEAVRARWRATAAAAYAASRAGASSVDTPAPRHGGHRLDTRSAVEAVMTAQSCLESLIESRALSAERLVALMVTFHAMAARVASYWPLTFDVARSQSGLRIATTACPVSASDLGKSYDEGSAALGAGAAATLLPGLRDLSFHGGAGTGSGWLFLMRYVTRNMQAVRSALGLVPLADGSTHHGTAFTVFRVGSNNSLHGSLHGGVGGSRRGSLGGGSRHGSTGTLGGPGSSWHNGSFASLARIAEVTPTPAQRLLAEPLVGARI